MIQRSGVAWLASALLALTALAICTTIPTAPGPPTPPPSTNGASAAVAKVPIEVLGTPGTISTFQFVAPSGSTADTLYLQVHGLGYEGKASVRLNGGSWVTLTDSNVTYPKLEAGFFGMGGPMSTLRMTIPTAGWTPVNGTNQIDFRFNDADGKTIGYRVLNLNLRAGVTDLVDTNTFVYDDPSTWVPISTNLVDIAAGLAAWNATNITEAGVALRVACKDCHPRTGWDLKYFNYSDKSIIARSIFHGVPAATATNIASYIRSLSIPYEPKGRPWNPPYQPGPGIDSQPVRSWAAGSGLEWVLDTDTNTLAYIFPSGISASAVANGSIINAREIPLAAQLPDWNRWLPKVHPLDQYPTFYATNAYLAKYDSIIAALSTRSGLAAADYFESQKSPWDAAGQIAAEAKPATTDPGYALWAANERDKRHWRVVKTWEIMQEEAIEDYGDETSIFSAVPNGAAQNERRWFHGEVFRLGPHVIGTPKYDAFAAESMVWYQLQLVLNDGNRRNGSIVPIDWGYQHALNVSAWDNPTNMATYAIMVLNVIKGVEVGYNGIPIGTTHSFNPLKADTQRLQSQYKAAQMNAIPAELRAAVIEAVIDPWLTQIEGYSKAQMDSKGYTAGLVDRLNNHLDWFATVGVNSIIMNRIEVERDKFVGP